ncbi:MAG: hypothetical protein ACREP9_10530, partial [Candidatus Dormibacteraceae bacterium]
MLAIRNHMQTVLAGLAELQTELSQLDARLAQFTSSPTPIPVETRAVDESPADSLIDRLEQIRAGCE